MKLSFIIPAYNEADYIGKCLESILKEASGKNYDMEIIVVNNASTDNTAAVAQTFLGVKMVNENRKGISSARHAGFLAATGDLIANVDADTILTPGWINKVFAAFNKNPNLIALSGPHIFYDLSRIKNLGVRFFYYIGFISRFFNKLFFKKGVMLQGGNYVIKRSVLEKIGGYNPDFTFYGEETDIARRISQFGDVIFTFDLPIYASGRRLSKEGVLTMGIKYGINYFWVIIFKKPFTKKSIDIRK